MIKRKDKHDIQTDLSNHSAVISKRLIATLQPLDQNNKPVSKSVTLVLQPNGSIDVNPSFHFDFPTCYSNKVKSLKLSMADTKCPAYKAEWILGNLPSSIKTIDDNAISVTSAKLGPFVIKAQAAEVPESNLNLESQLVQAKHEVDGSISANIYPVESHIQSVYQSIYCSLRIKSSDFSPGHEWVIGPFNTYAQWNTGNINTQPINPSFLSDSQYSRISPGKWHGLYNYCATSFPDQQKYAGVVGLVQLRKWRYETVVFRDADIVYDKNRKRNYLFWKKDQIVKTPSGITLKILNSRRRENAINANTGLPGFGYYASNTLTPVNTQTPSNGVLTELYLAQLSGIKKIIIGSVSVNRFGEYISKPKIPAPYSIMNENENDPRSDVNGWYLVYELNDNAADTHKTGPSISPKIKELEDGGYKLLHCRVFIPKNIAATGHINELKVIIPSYAVVESHPIKLTIPVKKAFDTDFVLKPVRMHLYPVTTAGRNIWRWYNVMIDGVVRNVVIPDQINAGG